MQKGFSSSFGTDVVRDLENKLARNLVVVVVLAAGGVALSTVEVYWLWAHGGESDAACEFLKLLSSFFTLWLIGFLFLYYRRTFELMKETNSLLRQDTLASSGLILSTQRWSFVPEALAYLVHPLPFVCVELSVPYYDLKRGQGYTTTVNSDELACLFMMAARALLLLRCAPYVAGFAGRQSRMYANLNHLDLSTGLALRLTFLRAPARLLGAVTVVLLAVAGFALQLAERRVNHDLDDYANCFWLAVVSMTGIGFGELYPQTPIGRVASAAAFAWGALLSALIILTLMSSTRLTEAESRVSKMIEHGRSRANIKQRAASYIQAAWASYLERLQRTQSVMSTSSLLAHEPLHADPKFCRAMRSFRTTRKSLAHTDDYIHLIYKELLDTRTRVEVRMRDVEEKLEDMDAKFEQNIAAMNELLQKNLKLLKHMA